MPRLGRFSQNQSHIACDDTHISQPEVHVIDSFIELLLLIGFPQLLRLLLDVLQQALPLVLQRVDVPQHLRLVIRTLVVVYQS